MTKDHDLGPVGGSYVQIPVNNSIAVKRVMSWQHKPLSSEVHQHREPYPPFAADFNRPAKQPRASSGTYLL